jgi:hypothetical protein
VIPFAFSETDKVIALVTLEDKKTASARFVIK